MKKLKLIFLAGLAAFAIACDKKDGGGGTAAVTPNQASAVCNGWYTMGNTNQGNQYGGYGYGGGYYQQQYQVYCYVMPSYGYSYGYNNGYNNGQNQTYRSNCAGYTLTEMATGRQVTCQ